MIYKGNILYLIFLAVIFISCQTNTPSGNEIVFTDVIGNYEGECADYSVTTSQLMNREEATLSIIAASIDAAGIKTSCDRIADQDLPLRSASAAEIVFQKSVDSTVVTMTYIAEADSVVIMQTTNGKDDNLIFTGKRI